MAVNVGDAVKLVRRYGDHTLVLPAIVLATEEHKRLRHIEGTEDWEHAPDDADHQGVLDLTNADPPAAGTVHVVYFAMTGGQPARLELNVPTKKGAKQGIWVEP